MVLSVSMAKRKGCVIGWRMNKKYGMGSDGNTSVRMCPVITCICDRPNHNHKLYLPRSKIQTCLHHSYLSLGQSLHLFFLSGLDQQLNNLRCRHWFWNLPLDPLASPFPSFIVPFSNSVSQSWSSVAVSPPGRFSLNNLPSSVQWRPELWAAVQLLRTQERTTLVCTALCAVCTVCVCVRF